MIIIVVTGDRREVVIGEKIPEELLGHTSSRDTFVCPAVLVEVCKTAYSVLLETICWTRNNYYSYCWSQGNGLESPMMVKLSRRGNLGLRHEFDVLETLRRMCPGHFVDTVMFVSGTQEDVKLRAVDGADCSGLDAMVMQTGSEDLEEFLVKTIDVI